MGNTFDINSYLRTRIAQAARSEITKEELVNKVREVTVLTDKKSELLKMSLLPMLYIDTYKVTSFRIKNGFADKDDYQILTYLDEFDDLEQFSNFIYENQSYARYAIDCVETFDSTPYLGRIRIIKSLSEDENERLSEFSEFHTNDIDKYDIEITEDFLFNYFNNYYDY